MKKPVPCIEMDMTMTWKKELLVRARERIGSETNTTNATSVPIGVPIGDVGVLFCAKECHEGHVFRRRAIGPDVPAQSFTDDVVLYIVPATRTYVCHICKRVGMPICCFPQRISSKLNEDEYWLTCTLCAKALARKRYRAIPMDEDDDW